MKTMGKELFLLLFVILINIDSSFTAQITTVTPNKGSLNGGTLLLISGSGLPKDYFQTTGNSVKFVDVNNELYQYDCEIFIQQSNEGLLQCYTTPMPEGEYKLSVTLEGQAATICTAWNCRFRAYSSRTPTVSMVTPLSGPPGTFVKLDGKIFTNKHGSNVAAADNGKTVAIKKAFAGAGILCHLQDITKLTGTASPYGLVLDSETSDNGYMICLPEGTSIASKYLSYMVDGEYGLSLAEPLTQYVSATDQIYMHQTYAEITSVSPVTGSEKGGLRLAVNGRNFEESRYTRKAKIYIAGQECAIESLTTTKIICVTPPKPSQSFYAGNRGITWEYWTGESRSFSLLPEVSALTSAGSGYVQEHLDWAYFSNDTYDNYVSRLTGYFVPPHTGTWSFHIKGDDGGILYVSTDMDPANKVQVASLSSSSSTFTKQASQNSNRVSLVAGQSYYMEALHREGTNTANVHVAAAHYETKFLNTDTGHAVQEVQKLQLSTNVVWETQDVSFSITETTKIDEVQDVSVTPDPGTSETAGFKLGLYGVYTSPLTLLTADSDVANAIKAIPILEGEDVTVTSTQINSNGKKYTVTLVSERGNWPDMTVMGIYGASFTTSVAEITTGRPNGTQVSFLFDGVPSPLVSATASAGGMETAMLGLFSTRCPSFLTSPSGSKKVYNFESSKPSFMSGSRTNDVEAFCGRYVGENSRTLYDKESTGGILLNSYGYLCFAYRGKLQSSIELVYTYKDDQSEDLSTGKVFTHDLYYDEMDKEKWYYTCMNMYDEIKSVFLDAGNPVPAPIKLEKAKLREEGGQVYYIDAVAIVNEATTTDYANILQYRQAPPSPGGAHINQPTVIKNNNVYNIELRSSNCGNNFPLFQVGTGQLPPSSSATIVQDKAASVPIGGTFKLTYNGVTKDVSTSLTATELKNLIELNFPNVGTVSVVREGDCANYHYLVTFLTLRGNQPEFQVSNTGLTGTNAQVTVIVEEDGRLYYSPIAGDLLRTKHTTPQVSAVINGIPTKCSGDCTFEWTLGSTPTVTSVNPTIEQHVTSPESITISGSGFDTTLGNNKVMIGANSESECTVTAATSNSITCEIGKGALGPQKVEVTVAGKGHASHPNSGDVTFEYTSGIDSISPTTVALGGGLTLSINGYGFRNDATVTVGGTSCGDLTITSELITCTLPANSAGMQSVVVTQNGQTFNSATSVNYDDSITAKITSVTPSTASVEGGQTVVIQGSGFGTSGSLMIDGVTMTALTFTDTEVTATLPALSSGSHTLKLLISTNGYAVLSSTNQLPSIPYSLKVNNVYPLKGALYGGTRLTLTGEGFSTNKSVIEVKVGTVTCDVESAISTEIICLLGDAGMTHEIANTGSHYVFGEGYGWSETNKVIKVGDTVQWKWSYPSWINDVTPRIEQTLDESSTTFIGDGGFRSGTTGVKNGQYMHKFTRTGTYYYWTGYANSHQSVWFRGTVEVEPLTSHMESVTVKVAGHEAEYDPNSGVSDPTDSSSCTAVINSCSDNSLTAAAGRFGFAFLECGTPEVTEILPRSGTTDDLIEISGSGFHTIDCNNEVMIGDGNCLVQSSSASSVSCKVDPSSELPIGTPLYVGLRVKNIGNALLKIRGDLNRTFALVPLVESISPTNGSLGGETILTLSGSGFDGTTSDVLVQVNGFPCAVESVSYTEITCKTPALSAGSKTIAVSVRSIPAEICSMCQFEYTADDTPVISTVSPASVSGNGATTVTITGSNLESAAGGNSGTTVTVGGESCTVTSVSNSEVVCTITNAPCGTQKVELWVSGSGKATSSGTDDEIASDSTIISMTPATGSTNGGTELQITGNGFIQGQTTVTVDGSTCVISDVTLSQVTCTTPAHGAATVSVAVAVSSCSNYPSQSFEYSAAVTPVVSSINPMETSSGNSVTITGDKFSLNNADNKVTIGGVECVVTSSATQSIACTLGAKVAGSYPIVVDVTGQGLSNNNVMFTYSMTATGVTPNSGSTGGGQTVDIQGTGFEVDTDVQICGQPCVKSTTAMSTPNSFICETPAYSGTVTTTQMCDVVVTVNGVVKTIANGYTYDASLTPEVTSINPVRGGTGGGTSLTVNGAGFGTDPSVSSVTIGDGDCSIDSITNTEIICTTASSTTSASYKVKVQIGSTGIAKTTVTFQYIDVWSSLFTWGGTSLPQDGELITIQKGQIVLLDTITAKLKMLIIQGELIFDEQDVELHAENILVTDGGLLQVGTEANPFQHKATIMLHGHHKTKELPIYGMKSLGVRHGTLELHGIPVEVTWTKLAQTAAAGASQIVLQQEVTWRAGDQILIATTSHMTSQHETEVVTIQSVAADSVTINLVETLNYTHLGVSESLCNGKMVDFRAEVGLLTHNVVVRGSRDPAWDEFVEACPQKFNPGEFATQTCFQGRFGEEITSDQLGGIILIHSPNKNSQEALAHIEHVEITHAGQAFRLGRYPVHFHLNGDSSQSYVRGCSIHHTFNRAVNIHDVTNLVVERNVVYNVMGGAMFLEDGIEEYNTMQYNLVVFVHPSSSLLNDDIVPASFWATHPNNIIRHNAAAGGSHFGFWYRMREHPEGPSFTKTVCPRHGLMGEFYNNSAHSFGWFGLWIFETYTPRVDGTCGSSTPKPARFENLVSWHNEKGAEFVNSGAIQGIDFTLVNNKKAGFEVKKVVEGEQFSKTNGPLLNNSCIVGYSTNVNAQGCTTGAIVLPYGNGFSFSGITFENFDQSSCTAVVWTRITGTCSDGCGGFFYEAQLSTFINAPNKVQYAWLYEGIIVDLDGTFTGNLTKTIVVPTSGILPTAECTTFSGSNGGIPASVCSPNYNCIRFSWNGINPDSLDYKNAKFTNDFGFALSPWKKKRITHPKGWMTCLTTDQAYAWEFENAAQSPNISYSGRFYRLTDQDSFIMKYPLDRKPDQVKINNALIPERNETLNATNCYMYDWVYDENTKDLKYCVSGRTRTSRKKRSVATQDIGFNLQAYRCYYKDCKVPVLDEQTYPPTRRPDSYCLWSDTTSWQDTSSADEAPRNCGVNKDLADTKPVDGHSVEIRLGEWMVVDELTPIMNKLILRGSLEFDPDYSGVGTYLDFELRVTYLVLHGGRLIVGWPTQPFMGTMSIILQGQLSDPPMTDFDQPIHPRTLIAAGGLELHGKTVQTSWTRLSQTANAGDSTISLEVPVNWAVDDEIVIAPTGYRAWETETFKITSISANKQVLSLNGTLNYKHAVHKETLSTGQTLDLAAQVGHFTRNIKIFGDPYPNMQKDSFGAQVTVGMNSENGDTVSGYARISGVEFYNCGHEGHVSSFDPRYCLSYLNVGQVSSQIPSFIKDSAFHNAFSPAMGVYGTNGLVIENNVAHHMVWFCMETMSDNTTIKDNLFVLNIWDGAYQDRFEVANVRWYGCIEAIEATNLKASGNVVAGSERTAYHIQPQELTTAPGDLYSNNLAQASLIAVGLLPSDRILGISTGAMYSGFTAWKIPYFGIYFQTGVNAYVDQVTTVECGIGVFQHVIGPGAVSHVYADRLAVVRNSLIVGTTSGFDCTTDVLDSTDDNIKLSGLASPFKARNNGRVGIAMGTFQGGGNKAPEKPFTGIKTYPTIKGLQKIEGTTFAHFGTSCNGQEDTAITTPAGNDDGVHPTITQNIRKVDVHSDNVLFFHRPNLGKINSADCVDMDCDGKKKALVKDKDGSLFGTPCSVFPHSEWEWDGDRRRGLGDYRVPKEMQTDLAGNRIPMSTLAPHKGIIGNANCENHTDIWHAYKCDSLDYEMMIIESLDWDTETRRLSPVALLGDGYLDLINGPQDHGWCSGYTCRKRVSTFMALVKTGYEYLMHFTSTSPEKLRFFLLSTETNNNASVLIKTWYSTSNRRDVYVNGRYIKPKNGYINANGDEMLRPPSQGQPQEYVPDLATDLNGANYFDRDEQLFYVLLRGEEPTTIETKKTIIVSFQFPPLSVDEFFGENIMMHVCAFFNLPISKCRVVNIVSANQSGRRRRRSTSNDIVVGEIANEPSDNQNDTVPYEVSDGDLDNITETLISKGQAGSLGEVTNTSEPDGFGIGYDTIPQVYSLCFSVQPNPQHEVVPFATQPKIRACDEQGNPISVLGTALSPWILNATIKAGSGSNAAAMLTGNYTIQFVDGWANFTDLALSQSGSGFIIEFNVISPADAQNFSIDSSALTINSRPIKATVVTMATDVVEDVYISSLLELRDELSDQMIEDITWRGHTWTLTVELGQQSPTSGSVNGTTTATFDPLTSRANMSFGLTNYGMYLVRFRVTTTPAEYDFSAEVLVKVKSQSQAAMVIESTKTLSMKFDADYNTVVGTGTSYNNFYTWVSNWLMYYFTDVIISNIVLSSGSIVVTFTVDGTNSGVNSTISGMCSTISNGSSLSYSGYTLTISTYLNVDGSTYYGVSCGTTAATSDTVPLAVIIAVSVIGALILIAIISFILWKCTVVPKAKTHDIGKAKYFGDRDDPIEDILFREKTFMSIRDQVPVSPIPPLATIIEDSKHGHRPWSRPHSKSPALSPPPDYSTVIRVATPVQKPIWKF